MRRAVARWLLLIASLFVVIALAVSIAVSRPVFDARLDSTSITHVAIADPAEALTFARADLAGRRHVLLVLQYREGKVVGVDLNRRLGVDDTDPIALLAKLGYDALQQQSASILNVVAIDADALAVPFDAPAHNVGVGLNYREHAQESQLEEEPFLFPKIAAPTPAFSPISRAGSMLLDYEAEVGLVALRDITLAEPPLPFGLVLANEVTDRWKLVRHLDRDAPMGTTGFADGKSGPGFAPIGPLLVVPRDLEAFLEKVELRLYLNGRLRQREAAATMLWGPRRILAEIFWRADTAFRYGDSTVSLMPAPRRMSAGTIVFSGTPAGVIFRPLNLWNPWVYLRPGDDVVVRADFLGVVRNRIVD